jgi:hypothetical protein
VKRLRLLSPAQSASHAAGRCDGSARFVLLGLPFHGAGGECGLIGARLRFALLLVACAARRTYS